MRLKGFVFFMPSQAGHTQRVPMVNISIKNALLMLSLRQISFNIGVAAASSSLHLAIRPCMCSQNEATKTLIYCKINFNVFL